MQTEPIHCSGGSHYIKFLKYLTIGGSAALLDFVVFVATYYFLQDLGHANSAFGFNIDTTTLANTSGIFLGFLWSFCLNKYWAFRSQNEFGTQFLLVGALLIFNVIITSFFITLLQDTLDLPIEWAKVIMQAVVVGWNYLIYHYVIFKK